MIVLQAKVWAMQRLRDAGNRLKSPELAAAWGVWHTSMQSARELRLAMKGANAGSKLKTQSERLVELEAEYAILGSNAFADTCLCAFGGARS